jgi:hypothetical protein
MSEKLSRRSIGIVAGLIAAAALASTACAVWMIVAGQGSPALVGSAAAILAAVAAVLAAQRRKKS